MSKNNLYPAIRFKEFTNAWEQEKLGNTGETRSGISLESFLDNTSKYKFISIGSFGEDNTYVDQNLRVKLNDKTKKFLLKKDDLVMILNDKTQTRNILGRVIFIERNNSYIHNQRTHKITPEKSIFSPYFLYHYINSNNFRKKIKKNSQGNTQVYVNWSTIQNIFLYYPANKNEQNKISNVITKLNNLITLHQRKLKALENIKKTLLDKMFPDEKSNIPSIRFKEFTNAWEQEKVGKVYKVSRGYVLAKEKISKVKSHFWKYPVYSSQTENNGLMGFYSDFLYESSITWTTDGAYAGDVKYREGKFFCTNVCGILINKNGFSNLANAISINKVAWKHVTKVGNPKLMSNTMENIIFKFSKSLKEQSYISSIFKILNNLITLHQRKIKKLENIKKTLLEKMFV